MIGKVINFVSIWHGFIIDFGRILYDFWTIFQALYLIGFQGRSKSDFGQILTPKTSKIDILNFAGSVS